MAEYPKKIDDETLQALHCVQQPAQRQSFHPRDMVNFSNTRSIKQCIDCNVKNECPRHNIDHQEFEAMIFRC